jgi:hypothetical protein
LDTSFRTPAEVVSELNVPVLGAISLKQNFPDSWSGNGNGNGGGEAGSRGERVAESEAADDESARYARQGKL